MDLRNSDGFLPSYPTAKDVSCRAGSLRPKDIPEGERNMLTFLHTAGSLQSHLGCSFCTLDDNFRVRFPYLRGSFEPWNMSKESKLPRHLSRLKIWSKRGIMDGANTYICLFGRTFAANLPAIAIIRRGCADVWRVRYGLSAT